MARDFTRRGPRILAIVGLAFALVGATPAGATSSSIQPIAAPPGTTLARHQIAPDADQTQAQATPAVRDQEVTPMPAAGQVRTALAAHVTARMSTLTATRDPIVTLALPTPTGPESVVRITNDSRPGVEPTWLEAPWAATLDWDVTNAVAGGTPEDSGSKLVSLEWGTGDGTWTAAGSYPIILDRTAPAITAVDASQVVTEWSAPIPVTIEDIPGSGAAPEWSLDGQHWSPPSSVVDFGDIDLGGEYREGARTAWFRAVDLAGNVGDAVTATFTLAIPTQAKVDIQVELPRPAITGHLFTIRPVFPAGYRFPAGSFCKWKLVWHDDRPVDLTPWNESFGQLDFDRNASSGGCHELTFTLPYTMGLHYWFDVQLWKDDYTQIGWISTDNWRDPGLPRDRRLDEPEDHLIHDPVCVRPARELGDLGARLALVPVVRRGRLDASERRQLELLSDHRAASASAPGLGVREQGRRLHVHVSSLGDGRLDDPVVPVQPKRHQARRSDAARLLRPGCRRQAPCRLTAGGDPANRLSCRRGSAGDDQDDGPGPRDASHPGAAPVPPQRRGVEVRRPPNAHGEDAGPQARPDRNLRLSPSSQGPDGALESLEDGPNDQCALRADDSICVQVRRLLGGWRGPNRTRRERSRCRGDADVQRPLRLDRRAPRPGTRPGPGVD